LKQIESEIGKQGANVYISKQDLTELRGFNNPSDLIISAVRAAFLTLNYPQGELMEWTTMKNRIANIGFEIVDHKWTNISNQNF
jgi:hypothetical protein